MSTKHQFLVLEFVYGSTPTHEYFTTFDHEVSNGDNGQNYEPVAGIEVQLDPNVGTIVEQYLTIRVAKGAARLFDALATGAAHAPVQLIVGVVFMDVGDVGFGGESGDGARILGTDYQLVRVTKAPSGEHGVIELAFTPLRSRMNVPCGIASTPNCAWSLGDKSCQIGSTVTAAQKTAVVSAIDRKKLTIVHDAGVTSGTTTGNSTWWKNGFVSYDGLSLGIRDWAAGSDDFQLYREPPQAWIGKTVTLRPGCDKTKSDCVTKWSNEEHFGGFGRAIPAYHPGLEAP